jgi:hypothetical protein
LLTEAAKAESIKNGIAKAAAELEPGDMFFLTYSGHGGQVPDLNDEERDGSDETWLAFDRQIVDDEVFDLFTRFRPGVRILVLSDSSYSGALTRAITDGKVVIDPVATAEEADKQEPRLRAMPRDKMIQTYGQNIALYDSVQRTVPSLSESQQKLASRVLLISGCGSDQYSRDGSANGAFTAQLLEVWGDGAWTGGYAPFLEAIRSRMPEVQQPNYAAIGPDNPAFEEQPAFTIG